MRAYSSRSVSALIAVAVAVVLVGTVLVPGETAVAAPAVRDEVPVPESAPLVDIPTGAPEGVFEAPALPYAEAALFYNQAPGIDFDAPVEGFDPVLSEATERTEFSILYDNADGTQTTEMSFEPLNVMVDGEWQEVQTSLSAEGDGAWGVEVNPLSPTFSALASDEARSRSSATVTRSRSPWWERTTAS